MLRLTLKIIAVLLVVALVNVGLLLALEAPQDHYIRAFFEKNAELQAAEPGSVVLVGGSSVAFDYDAAQLSDALDRPVVNTGLHVGLGLRFILDSTTPYIKEGDLVLLQLEYQQYINSPDTADQLRMALGIDPQATAEYLNSPGQWWSIAQYHSQFTVRQLWAQVMGPLNYCPGSAYCLSSFNAEGNINPDFVVRDRSSERAVAQDIEEYGYIEGQAYSDEALRLLNAFADEVRARGAEVLIIYPVVPEVVLERDGAAVAALQAHLDEALTIAALNDPFSYPVDRFYDTVYHLNSTGRVAYTEQIGEWLVAAGYAEANPR